MTFKLEKVEELSGVHAVWISESYTVYATPYFDGVAVSVQVVDSNNEPIGTDGYNFEIAQLLKSFYIEYISYSYVVW